MKPLLPAPSTCLALFAMILLGAATPLFCAESAASRDGWTLTASETLPGPADGITHRKQTLSGVANARATIHLLIFDASRYTFRVLDQQQGGQASVEEVLRRNHCVAGTNGGYFRTDFDPVGLLVCDGHVVEPLSRARLLSGALVVTRNHHMALRRVNRPMHDKHAWQALQCGPFLVENGKLVLGLNATHLADRVALITNGWGRWGIAVASNEVTLEDFGAILANPALLPEGMKVQSALNLDGGHSTSLWSLQPGAEPFYLKEGGSVRDFVGIVPREAGGRAAQ